MQAQELFLTMVTAALQTRALMQPGSSWMAVVGGIRRAHDVAPCCLIGSPRRLEELVYEFVTWFWDMNMAEEKRPAWLQFKIE